MTTDINAILNRLSRSRFRSRFHLSEKEFDALRTKGSSVIREHGREIITKRLAPAHPSKDGKQTPYRGHPVFVAQHATATCCRTCLTRWHGIQKGKELSDNEIDYILDVIDLWLARDVNGGKLPLGV